MLDNLFIISIGGSGARAARAFTHLCAMGFGPDKVKFFFVDIDINNGDFIITRDTIQSYIKIREQLRGEINFFKTEIELLTPTAWSPLTGLNLDHNTLRSYLTYLPTPSEYKKSEKLLFSEAELDVSLDQGCRAHPNIGSFLISAIFQDPEFRDGLQDTLKKNGTGIYLYHSIFGGTGAAGGPVIIKGINQRFKKGDQVSEDQGFEPRPIGDSVLFPYFDVTESKDPEELLKIKSETFDFNAAGALPFYKDSVPADRVYVLGDQKKPTYEYNAGNKEQKNPAHVLELFAALMTLDFYHKDFDENQLGKTEFYNPVFGDDNKPNDYSIYFDDIPKKGDIAGVSKKQRIIDFQLTSTFYQYFYNQSRRQKLKDYVWLNDLFDKNDTLSNKVFDNLNVYFTFYNTWMQQMHNNTPKLELFNNIAEVDMLFRNIDKHPLKEVDYHYKYLNIADRNNKKYLEGLINKMYRGFNKFTTEFKIAGGNNA